MKNCPKCKTPNVDDASFCKACGSPMPKTGEKPRCVNGHILDPSWTDCPICQAGSQSQMQRRTTTVEPNDFGPPPKDSPRRKTKIETAVPENSAASSFETDNPLKRKKTRVAGYDDDPAADAPGSAPGKLVGFLVTFSFNPAGKYFEIREGRSLIGSGDGVDMCMAEDKLMSSRHAVLLYRRGRFLFRDDMSTNGSWVNGEETTQDVELRNYDRVNMGNTEFRLLIIDPPGDGRP
ncbi:MAG: FHA domain-containing protein [Pseudomonadota bacterium]